MHRQISARSFLTLLLALLFLPITYSSALSQQATGSIKGTVTDPQKAIVPGADVLVRNIATGAERKAITDPGGQFVVPQLQPGDYQLTFSARGFKVSKLQLALSVGDTLTTDVSLEVGGASETVNVSADTATVINTADYKVDGVITRQKVDSLPLNGRNFLQLSQLEPGVKVSTGSPGEYNNLFNVSIGGGDSSLTRLTVDGGNIVDPVTGYAAQNFSVDTVQEFQISSFNFDLATGVTSVGAINIISRTGRNDFFGSAFLFYRDNHMSAYPTLNRVGDGKNPFFRRLQTGFTLGGPIRKDKLVWFTNLERLNQTTAFSTINTGNPMFSQFDTVTSSPYKGWLYNARFDYTINSKHSASLRFSSDVNNTFAPREQNVMPSLWRQNRNNVYQTQGTWIATWKPNLTNSLSFNWQYIGNKSLVPVDACGGCIGVNGPQVQVNGSSFRIGNNTDAPQNRAVHRYETNDNLSWTVGSNLIQTGINWEPAFGTGSWSFVDPALVVTHDPRSIIQVNSVVDALVSGFGGLSPTLAATFAPFASVLKLPLPADFTTPGAKITYNDILNLPVAYVLRGLGDGAQPPPYNGDYAKHTQRVRLYGQNTQQLKKGLTLKYGVSYLYEDKLWNSDLKKSALFQELYGGAQANPIDKKHFAPAIGFAWNVGQNNKTVIRGGYSLAYDTSLYVNRLTERAILGPLGNGRVILPGDFFQNSTQFVPTGLQGPYSQLVAALPGIASQIQALAATPGLSQSQVTDLLTVAGIVPLLPAVNPALGARLGASTLQVLPTRLTTAAALQMLADQGSAIQGQFNQLGSAGVIGADFFKAVTQTSVIIDPNIKIPYSQTFSIGVQRQLPWDMVLNADFVFRRYLHGFFQRDRALWNRSAQAGGPLIRACASAAEATNPTVKCLNGPIEVIEGSGRETYKALLLKAEKRFNNRYQFTASYALSKNSGFDYGRDIQNPFSFPGYQSGDRTHSFTFSGLMKLPWGFNGGLIATYESRPPLSATIPGSNNSDVNGDGTNNDFLPGVGWNNLGRTIGADQLRELVAQWNAKYAGKAAPRGGVFPVLTLPANFEFGDIFQSHDLRLTREFKYKEKYSLEIIGEVFNIFNISNKTGYSGSIDAGFGAPTSKANPIIGVGGPRIFQLAARIKF